MPRPPGFFGQVNYVINAWSNPCDAPLAIYVETLGPAALRALISLVCFGIDDVIRWIFRPAGIGRRVRRTRRGKAGQRRSLVSRARSRVPVWTALHRRHVTNGVKNLWIIDTVGQRILFWWMVIDVAAEFAYNWTTLIYKSEQCQMALAPGAELREVDTDIRLGILGWDAMAYPDLSYTKGDIVSVATGAVLGPGEWTVVIGCDWENFMDVDVQAQIRIRSGLPPGEVLAQSQQLNINAGTRGTVMTTATIPTNKNIVYEARSIGGNLGDGGGALFIMGTPPEVPPPTKFSCGTEPFFRPL